MKIFLRMLVVIAGLVAVGRIVTVTTLGIYSGTILLAVALVAILGACSGPVKA